MTGKFCLLVVKFTAAKNTASVTEYHNWCVNDLDMREIKTTLDLGIDKQVSKVTQTDGFFKTN